MFRCHGAFVFSPLCSCALNLVFVVRFGCGGGQGRAAFNAPDFPWGFWQGYSFISRLHSPCNKPSMALVLRLLPVLNRAHFAACVKVVCPPGSGRDTQGQGHKPSSVPNGRLFSFSTFTHICFFSLHHSESKLPFCFCHL